MAKTIVETPLMKQYAEMKTKHPDAILLFRVGDFYEIFGKDAADCAEILGITLTRRANGQHVYIELAGFPHHALDAYLPKLIRAGKRVAICEQLEDPKAGGVVKRWEPETETEEPQAGETATETETEEPEPAMAESEPEEPALKSELRECVLAQLPGGAEIVAAEYVAIGEDNGKWKLVLKMGDGFRYADMVGKARFLYVCTRGFDTAEEVAALMAIPMKAQTEATPEEPQAEAEQAAEEPQCKGNSSAGWPKTARACKRSRPL